MWSINKLITMDDTVYVSFFASGSLLQDKLDCSVQGINSVVFLIIHTAMLLILLRKMHSMHNRSVHIYSVRWSFFQILICFFSPLRHRDIIIQSCLYNMCSLMTSKALNRMLWKQKCLLYCQSWILQEPEHSFGFYLWCKTFKDRLISMNKAYFLLMRHDFIA